MGAVRFGRAKGQQNDVGLLQRRSHVMAAHFGQGCGTFLRVEIGARERLAGWWVLAEYIAS